MNRKDKALLELKYLAKFDRFLWNLHKKIRKRMKKIIKQTEFIRASKPENCSKCGLSTQFPILYNSYFYCQYCIDSKNS